MCEVLIRLGVAGAISLPVVALNTFEAKAQSCFVSEQVIEAGPTLVPAADRRTIAVEDWRITFAIPDSYRLLRDGLRMDILPPHNPWAANPCSTAQSRSVSISMVNRVVSEADIRDRLAPGEGTYLGLTSIPSGSAFMHTTRTQGNQVHLSIPFPDQPVSVVFTAHADSDGNIFQEGVFETILETFQFQD